MPIFSTHHEDELAGRGGVGDAMGILVIHERKARVDRSWCAQLLAAAGFVCGSLAMSGCWLGFPTAMPDDDGGQSDRAVDALASDATGDGGADSAADDGAEPDASLCGDGVLDTGEDCDDGNGVGGDGCDPSCRVEQGFHCAGEPSECATECGDGTIGGEECSNGSTTDCNPVGETLEPGAAWVDHAPPAGFIQCAGFINSSGNDVAADWDSGCLGQLRTLRIRYWETSTAPWTLLGDATLTPPSLAAYGTQVFDAVNHSGTDGVLETQGVTVLKDDPSATEVTTHECNPGHPTKRYGATDLYLGDESDQHTLFVCGLSRTDDGDSPCSDNRELHMVDASYEQGAGCCLQMGVETIAIAVYYEVVTP
jgi:cysteine-rich repeat protein